MRRRNNQGGGGNNPKHRHNNGGRRYNNNGGQNSGGSGNRDHQNLARQKHHATQMREKFMNHARDAQINGDRVDVEYYLQHVDHYNRVLADIGAIEAERHERHREQQQAQQAQQGPQGGEAHGDDAAQDIAAEQEPAAASTTTAEEEPIQLGNQPRMTRGPRRPQPAADDANGAKAANANKEEIPLPGGVLGAI